MTDGKQRKPRAKAAGNEWYGRFRHRLWDDGIYLIALAVIPATLLPMLDWGAVLLQLIVAALVVFYVLRTFGRRPIALALVGVGVLTLSGTAALLMKPGNKYVVPVDNWSDSIFASAYDGPAGPFHLVPTNSLYPVKRWLLTAVSHLDDRIVILDSFRSGDRTIAHSPTEVAAAALSGKEAGATGVIAFPWRREQFDLSIDPGSQFFSFNMQASESSLSLVSNLGNSSPGLFGVSTAATMDLAMWRRLAFAEETLRALPTTPSLEILESLGAEARRTGTWTDLLRFLTLQLGIVNARLPSSVAAGHLDVYELAKTGNLRTAAEIFVSRQPTRAIHDDPWFAPFSFALIRTASSIPVAQLNGNGRELSWLVDTLKKIADVAMDNSLAVAIDKPDDRAEDEAAERATALLDDMSSGRGDAATFADFFKLISAPDPMAPVKTGDEVRAEALVRADPDLDRDDVRTWIRAGKGAAGYRIELLDDALMDVVTPRFASIMSRIASGEVDVSTLSTIDAELSSLNRLSTALESLTPLIEDDDQRRVLEYSHAMRRGITSRFGSLFGDMKKCAGQGNSEDKCVVDLFSVMMPEFAGVMQLIRDQDSATPALSAYLQSRPSPGLPYSNEDHRYVSLLAGSLYSDNPAPGDIADLCKDTADKAGQLIEEGRIAARATLLAVQAETLRRCGDPKAATIDRLFTEKQMPFASWRGQLGSWSLISQSRPAGAAR